MNVCREARCRAWRPSATRAFKYDNNCAPAGPICISSFSTSSSAPNGIEPVRNPKLNYAKERQRAERNQLIQSLKSSPGKRDAKNFLKHFDTPAKTEPIVSAKVEKAVQDVVGQAHYNAWRLDKTGVNLGGLYEPTKAIQENPVFTQQPLPDQFLSENVEKLHIALVKLRQPQALDDDTLGGLGLTLSQLVRLGENIALVVDCDEDTTAHDKLELTPAWEKMVREQTTRVVRAMEEYNEPGAFEVHHALSYSTVDSEIPSTVQVRGGVEVRNNQLLFPPIENGIIAVIPPIAYTEDLRKVRVQPDEVVLALTREFAGLTSRNIDEEDPHGLAETLHHESKEVTDKPVLDRIVILDPLGGIPSERRADGAHVFINLEAEYMDVKKELQRGDAQTTTNEPRDKLSTFGNSNPFSKFAEKEMVPLPSSPASKIAGRATSDRHTRNLDVAQRALKLLPPSSTAFIVTPQEAAISSQAAFLPATSTGVGTRRSKNPLIHNLLTDKPMTSSSLPAALVTRPLASAAPNPSTFLKKGIPVTMIPDPRITGPWRPPSPDNPSIELENDPRINFPRLVDLIEDSFRRKLDAKHYLDRIRGRVAGIIVAGDYEGGAICTWETPPLPSPSSTDPLPPSSPLWVPYLDKFAVLTASQGAGGVADIVWGALTRSAFPEGVVWRSRTSNPVNKWYFERAVGMWNLEGGEWTMFWTTEGVVEEWRRLKGAGGAKGGETLETRIGSSVGGGGDALVKWGGEELTRWDAYVRVCKGVVPSWADPRKPD